MENVFSKNFNNKVAVITGAGGVLCGCFAKSLAKAGAKVALLNRSISSAEAIAQEIIKEGGIAKAYTCNVLDKNACSAIAEQVFSDFGPCDFLINGAGGNNPLGTTDKEYFSSDDEKDIKTFFDLTEDGVSSVFNLNFMGTFIPCQVFAKQMAGRKGCSIINISSMSAFHPLTRTPAYSGAKAAISNFTEWLAVHFSKEGIRVNAIAPGFFSTKQNENLMWNEDGTPTERNLKVMKATPMGRFGNPEELLGALHFLLDSQASSFITGIVLPVDGGFSAYSGV